MPSLNIELKNSSKKTVTETLPTPGFKEEKFNIYWTFAIFLLSMSPHELCVPVLQHLELQAEESESGGGEDVPGQDADTLPGTATVLQPQQTRYLELPSPPLFSSHRHSNNFHESIIQRRVIDMYL